MRDIITLHIGQAGIQIGNAVWELFCLEHMISENGSLTDETRNDSENKETFFTRTMGQKYVPKCLFIDLEPTVIDEIRLGPYRSLYHPDRLISGPEDASSNFARGFFTIGKLLLETVNKELRKLFESADYVQGIMLFRSLGGGSGSGLTSALFDGLSEFAKTSKIEFPIFPSPTLSMSTVEPYNSILAEHFCIEDFDVGLAFDNEALYDICKNFLNLYNPTFSSINRLISPLCSSITASLRFNNILNCDLTVLTTNLVPYPRIHFPLCNFAPILPVEKLYSESIGVRELTRYVFDKDNQMMKIDMTYGRYMSCALFYRGNISPKDVYSALLEIKNTKAIEFVSWCPTGFKVGINNSIPINIPGSKMAHLDKNIAMLTNSSAIGQAWQRLCHKFYLLYSKRAFLHWFVGEGMDECEFTEALYNISTLVKDYEEVTVDLSEVEVNYSRAQSKASKEQDVESVMQPEVKPEKRPSLEIRDELDKKIEPNKKKSQESQESQELQDVEINQDLRLSHSKHGSEDNSNNQNYNNYNNSFSAAAICSCKKCLNSNFKKI